MTDIIDYEYIPDAAEVWPKLAETFRRELSLSEGEIIVAVSIATGVCPSCYEYKRGCQCWNDE